MHPSLLPAPATLAFADASFYPEVRKENVPRASAGLGLQVLNIMNINANKQWFLRKFDEFDLDKNQHMDKDEFTQFVR